MKRRILAGSSLGVAAALIATLSFTDYTFEDWLDPLGTFADAPDEVEDAVSRALAHKLRSSEELKRAIVEEEGARLTVYRDITGLPTVGAGHLVRPEDGFRVGDRITREQMYQLLERDLKLSEAGVERIVLDLPVSQHEFDALVDLVYNVGPGNVSKSESPELHAAIIARDYQKIAENLIYTLDRTGRRAPGLVFRSERRQRMFRNRVYENPRIARN